MTTPNSTNVKLMVDNKVTSVRINGVLPYEDDAFYFQVNGSSDASVYEVGIDEFYLWSRELSNQENLALYNNGSGYFYPFVDYSISGYRVVESITIDNIGQDYISAPKVIIDNPTGGGVPASGYAVLSSDTGKVYADSFPAFSVGGTNSIVVDMMDGSGSFIMGNNDFLRVGNTIPNNDWSVFFNFSATGYRPTGVNAVLLSTMDSVNQSSGLIFGINDVNRLFFEYIDSSNLNSGQRRVFVQNQELSENNIISVSADSVHNSVTICNHNIGKQTSYGLSYYMPGYTPSNKMFLCGFANSENNPKYTGFFGLMKDILILSGAANTTQLNALAPLFCLTGYIPEGEIPYYTLSPIITGAYLAQMVVSSGITGYSMSEVSIPDKDGTNISAYAMLPQNGTISGTGIYYQTGSLSGINIAYSGVDEQLFYSQPYVRNYADANLVMLQYPILTGDLVEIYSFTDKWENKISVMPDAFNVNDFYLGENFDSNTANVYLNGLLQVTGVDYAIISGKIVSNNLAQYISVYSYLLYDEISGGTTISGWTGWEGQYSIEGDVTSGGAKDVYIDGQKLISGIDYTIVGTTVILTGTQFGESVSWSSGVLEFPPVRTGNRNIFTGSGLGYWQNFSSNLGKLMDEMVYVNGQRLAPGVDYITTSPYSFLNTDNRPGGWPQFWIYSGDFLPTGIIDVKPDLTSAISDDLVDKASPIPL